MRRYSLKAAKNAAALLFATQRRDVLTLEALADRLDVLEIRCSSRNSDNFDSIEYYAMKPKAELHLEEVARRCADPRYDAFLFSHRHLPIMLAQMIVQVGGLPCGLFAMQSIKKVRQVLLQSFNRLKDAPLPKTKEERSEYLKVVSVVNAAHENIIPAMAEGILELKRELLKYRSPSNMNKQQAMAEYLHGELVRISGALDNFNRAFVEFKFVSRQLESMHAPNQRGGCIGVLETSMKLEEVVKFAMAEARDICHSHYGDAPPVELYVVDDPAPFPHWAEVLHYITVEIVKNALRATVDHHMKRSAAGFVDCTDMPPVKVTVAAPASAEFASVCVSDEGGGMSRVTTERAMSYSYTSAAKPVMAPDANAVDDDTTREASPLAGYGYGLPMSRIYARCFGGDIQLSSVEGYGTKAFIYVKRRGLISSSSFPKAK